MGKNEGRHRDVDGQETFDGEVVRVPAKPKPPVPEGPIPAKHRVFNLKHVPGEGMVWFPGSEFVEKPWPGQENA